MVVGTMAVTGLGHVPVPVAVGGVAARAEAGIVVEPGGVDLHELLTDLRIVLEPCCEETGIELQWDVPQNLPLVQADRHSLLQVLLNLTKNSQRALEGVADKTISISAQARKDGVAIRVTDNGPGVADPHHLFQPLQKGADATGLGLYLSRAFLRSFRGELRHEPVETGCSFVIELALAPDMSEETTIEDPHATHTIVAS